MNGQQDLFDLTVSKALRDEGISRVSTNAGTFVERGLVAIAGLPGGDYTGERVRAAMLEQGIMPHHSNAWGALVKAAIRQRLLHPTGRFVPMRSKKSHAHTTQVYRKEAP